MKHFKYFLLIPIYIYLVGCVWPDGGGFPTPTAPINIAVQERPDSYYEQRREQDPDREEVLLKAKSRDTGRTCSGDKACEDICKEIYRSRNDRRDCEELPLSQVERLEELHELIEDADLDDLEGIDIRDFDVYVNVSIEPLEKEVGGYSSREAKDFLTWLARDREIVEIFEKEDDKFKMFDDLLRQVRGTGFDGLKENLDSGENFLDLAVYDNNEVALEMVHDYMEEKQCSNDLDTVACLQKYCELGDDMDRNNADDLFDYNYFERYIENIIENHVGWCAEGSSGSENCDGGSHRTWDKFYEDIDELAEWWKDLCK